MNNKNMSPGSYISGMILYAQKIINKPYDLRLLSMKFELIYIYLLCSEVFTLSPTCRG